MNRVGHIIGVAAVCLAHAVSARAVTLRCPPDSVKVGSICIDKYEASVWQIPPTNTALVKQVQAGRATLAELTGGGATQLSPATSCSLARYCPFVRPTHLPGASTSPPPLRNAPVIWTTT